MTPSTGSPPSGTPSTETQAQADARDARVSATIDVALASAGDSSGGKRAALELAESSRDEFEAHSTFAGSLFMGKTPWSLLHPWPAVDAEEAARGAEFHGKLEEVLRTTLDPELVDTTGEIPDAAIEALRGIGAFGIKIPREFGGLGLSQTNYTKAAMLLGSRCASTTAFLSAHQSIGLPQPLKLFGTDEQKRRLLPRLAAGELSAFALTEGEAGSDPARMTTTAEPTPDGKGWVVNGRKLWCTNGTRAKLIVVMAKTPPKVVGGRKRDQFTAFVVDADDPGVKVTHRCDFMGMKGLYNAEMTFTNVVVPDTDRIAPVGRGMKVALATLNTGRLTLPAACIGVARQCLRIVREWAVEREQWGAPIGKHAAIADKIARITAHLFGMESMTLLTSGLVDHKRGDIRLEAAMCKMWGTERAWEIINETMQIRGGRGYETVASLKGRGERPDPVERFMRDNRINMLFEGASEIMRLFIAREALDPHLKVAGDALNPHLGAGRRLAGLARAGAFYAGWYPGTFLPGGESPVGLHPRLAPHAARVGGESKRLARRLFHAMARYGPRLEREQVLLGRYVDIGTELFVQSASIVHAQHLVATGRRPDDVIPLVDLLCEQSLARIEQSWLGVRRNADDRGYAMAGRVMDGEFAWLEDGVVRDD